MLKTNVVMLAAAALIASTAPTRTIQAGDDIWDMMDPSWWADEFFDNDDDEDWWRYQRRLYNPYWGGPYMGGPYGWQRPYVIHIQTETEPQEPEVEPPE